MPALKNAKPYVYALSDPRNGEVFYVGKGVGRRAWAHVGQVRSGRETNPHKAKKIFEVLHAGCEPAITILHECETHQQAIDLERQEIKARPGLTNIAMGQRSWTPRVDGTLTPEIVARMMERDLVIYAERLATWNHETSPYPESAKALMRLIWDAFVKRIEFLGESRAKAVLDDYLERRYGLTFADISKPEMRAV